MNFNYKLENDVLTFSLQGRLDTEASVKFEAEYAVITKENPHTTLVVDASELEYIASSGLRTVLKMAKSGKTFRIESVSFGKNARNLYSQESKALGASTEQRLPLK